MSNNCIAAIRKSTTSDIFMFYNAMVFDESGVDPWTTLDLGDKGLRRYHRVDLSQEISQLRISPSKLRFHAVRNIGLAGKDRGHYAYELQACKANITPQS
jgi:hypothetical protein